MSKTVLFMLSFSIVWREREREIETESEKGEKIEICVKNSISMNIQCVTA